MSKNKTNNENTELYHLYQSLPLEQCTELYKKQRENLDSYSNNILLAIMGAKAVYGKDYVPGYNRNKNKDAGK